MLVKEQKTARVDVPTAMLWFVLLDGLMSALFPSWRRRSHHIGMKTDITVWDPGL